MDTLIKQLKKGNKQALDEIYGLYYAKILSFCRAYLKDENLALDIVQETFIKLWEKRASIQSNSKLEALLFTITKNALFDLFRKKATEEKYLDYLSAYQSSNSISTESIVGYESLKDEYEKLIPQLPQKRRQVFLMSRKEGLSNKEIAKRMGISEKTVENQITQALAFFRQELGKSGFLSMLFYFLFVG